MTPLAMYLANQLLVRPKHRKDMWVAEQNRKHLRDALCDTHFFEVTKAFPLLAQIAEPFKHMTDEQIVQKSDALFEKYSFLPAPKTWIEWLHESGNRVAVLLEERPQNDGIAAATFFCEWLAQGLGWISKTSGDYNDVGGERIFPEWLGYDGNTNKIAPALLSTAHCMLVIINTPRIIGRRQFMPHLRLERELTKQFGAGKFPLHAWTEIMLQVAKPTEIDDGQPHEAHLTGHRALHFVRKHIRIRLGRLEYVTSHWRGDPALGIKQSRYIVAP